MTDTKTLIEDLVRIVSTPRCSIDVRAQCIQHAYDIGKLAGQIEGAQAISDQISASITKSANISGA